CRSSYIYPSILSGFTEGRTIDRCVRSLDELTRARGLHPVEKAVLTMVQAEAKRPRRGAGYNRPRESLAKTLRRSLDRVRRPAPRSGRAHPPRRAAARR